jgi:hypothetical protein
MKLSGEISTIKLEEILFSPENGSKCTFNISGPQKHQIITKQFRQVLMLLQQN